MAKVGAVGEIEAGGKDAADPICLVDRRKTFHGLDGFWRLRAVVVFYQLNLCWAALELKPAARVDFVRPETIGREMGHCGARPKRPGFGADHSDFHNAGVRSGGSHKWCSDAARQYISEIRAVS